MQIEDKHIRRQAIAPSVTYTPWVKTFFIKLQQNKKYVGLHCIMWRTHDHHSGSTSEYTHPSELTKAHDFLYEADLLVTDVKSLFRNSGDFVIAARLKDIQGRLADELEPSSG